MIWQDTGFLLNKNKFSENASIAEFYTENHGKVTGVIYGSTSKKIKNYLFIGNKFFLNYSSKNENKIGYFKIEIDRVKTPFFLENKKKLSCIVYAMNIVKLLTVDNQENIKIYNLINNFFDILNNDVWIEKFIHWELEILKNIGYDINFSEYVTNTNVNGVQSYHVKLDSSRAVPSFLVDKKLTNVDNTELIKGLELVGSFIDKTILKPNNISYPNSRLEFVNLIK